MKKTTAEQVNRVVEKQLRRATMEIPERRKRRMALRQAGGQRVRILRKLPCPAGHVNCRTEILSNQTVRHIMYQGGAQ